MGGSSLQFLLNLVLLLLCMKPKAGNNLGLADTHLTLAAKSMRDKLFSRLNKTLLIIMAKKVICKLVNYKNTSII